MVKTNHCFYKLGDFIFRDMLLGKGIIPQPNRHSDEHIFLKVGESPSSNTPDNNNLTALDPISMAANFN
jgi:hypothetical protein